MARNNEKEKETVKVPSDLEVDTSALNVTMKSTKKKDKSNKKTGPTKRIPDEWKVKMVKMDPLLKKRLIKAVGIAHALDLKEIDLQDLFINEAIKAYLDSFEKKYQIKTK